MYVLRYLQVTIKNALFESVEERWEIMEEWLEDCLGC